MHKVCLPHVSSTSASKTRRTLLVSTNFVFLGTETDPPSYIPSVKDYFVDRRRETRMLLRHLSPLNPGERVFLVSGQGGTGKTQLAANFVKTYFQAFSWVIWLNATTISNLVQSVFSLASDSTYSRPPTLGKVKTDVEGVIAMLQEWLIRKENRKWLMIIDDVTEESNSLSFRVIDACLTGFSRRESESPKSTYGSVLLTTRLSSLEVEVQSAKLTGFRVRESLKLVRMLHIHESGKEIKHT